MTDSSMNQSKAGFPKIPTWSVFMRPVLEVLADGRQWQRRALATAVLDLMGITEAQRAELLPAGDSRALNRVGWALSGLKRAEAIAAPQRAIFQITEAGRGLLESHPEAIAENDLKLIPAYQDYVPIRGRSTGDELTESRVANSDDDPLEQIESGISSFEADVATDLLRRLREVHPDYFEQVVVDLLVAMGYGGEEQRGQRIGRSGDGGVDGVIDEDALGLSRIYVQAKRYAAGRTVERPELQSFVGALLGRDATKGVFVTTGRFSASAPETVKNIQSHVVLIDGNRLAELMIRYRVGVQVKKTYDLLEVDEDYFE